MYHIHNTLYIYVIQIQRKKKYCVTLFVLETRNAIIMFEKYVTDLYFSKYNNCKNTIFIVLCMILQSYD